MRKIEEKQHDLEALPTEDSDGSTVTTHAGRNPRETAPWYSILTFSWLDSLLKKGWTHPLEPSDIWRVPSSMQSEVLANRFYTQWTTDLKDYRTKKAAGLFKQGKEPTEGMLLRSTLWNLYATKVISRGFLRLGADSLTMFAPYLLKLLLQWSVDRASEKNLGSWEGPVLVVGIFLCQLISSVFQSHYQQAAFILGAEMRTMLTSAIYRKTLKLTAAARSEFNSGKVVNLVSTDTNRVELFISFCNFIWTIPVFVIVIVAFLLTTIGWAALVGISVLLLTFPLQTYLFSQIKQIRAKQAPITDQRVKLTTEILNGVRVIKFFAWEIPFAKQIAGIRVGELAQVLKRGVLQAYVMTQAFSMPILCSCVAFIVYGLTNTLSAAAIFSSMSWFNLLRFPIFMLPNVLNSWAEFNVALARIEGLLLASEVDEIAPIDGSLPVAVELKDCEFAWGGDVGEKLPKGKPPRKPLFGGGNGGGFGGRGGAAKGGKPAPPDSAELSSFDSLKGVNLSVPKGALVAIVGPVGSGKSSLVNALIGEMRKVQGSMKFSGNLAYAAQSAWIKNASLKENVLFDRTYDHDRYVRALRDAALLPDLKILPDGDQTSIGERGINMSGGQKQRVNLARLLYSDAEIVLMDDVLSALDAHVGRFVFHGAIANNMKGRTRILVTHQLHYLPYVDMVVVMKDGQVVEQGSYTELVSQNGVFSEMVKNYGFDSDNDSGEENEKLYKSDEEDELKQLDVLVSTTRNAKDIMQVEDRETGKVSSNVWWSYVKASGHWKFLFELSVILLALQASRIGNDLWLTYWTSDQFHLTTIDYVIGYTVFGLGQTFLTLAYALYFAYASTRAARTLHTDALDRVLAAPVSFFDTTPIGRVINRFSRDVDQVDNTISFNFRQLVQQLAIVISTFAVMCYAIPLFTIPVVPAIALYYFIQNVYRYTSRELKRLDSITKSPFYANFGETLTGMATIRAYRNEESFVLRNDNYTDNNNSPYYLLMTAQSWLAFRLQLVGSILVALAGCIGVVDTSISASFFGLAISYSLNVTQVLSFAVQNFTQTEIAMNSVERVFHYATKIEVEPPAIIEDNRPPPEWPLSGEVEFKDVKMAYAEHMPLVLKDVSFVVKPREKIGIVGRTGSGKSSLMQSLFRMFEISDGKIIIDGIETSTIGLRDLRSRLAIIPQDPVVFSGSFRTNLDPFTEHTDDELWDAIDRAGLKSKVTRSEGKLDAPVEAGGENLSVGERQLLCLARALLKKPKILVMDEATANVDYETDAMIQKVLREDFTEATVLTIAHRLNTIIDYSRVLFLDSGRVVEYDSPAHLLADPSSAFSALVRQTGDANAVLLKRLADEAAEKER
ncbi:P-loop containing nucleoside triphosphate hydrolase protein [Cladochytrium replicatum]|nr:P-loop containing nucleoside triphosphate hydrolase protein [Cladochytrium replicatum]